MISIWFIKIIEIDFTNEANDELINFNAVKSIWLGKGNAA